MATGVYRERTRVAYRRRPRVFTAPAAGGGGDIAGNMGVSLSLSGGTEFEPYEVLSELISGYAFLGNVTVHIPTSISGDVDMDIDFDGDIDTPLIPRMNNKSVGVGSTRRSASAVGSPV